MSRLHAPLRLIASASCLAPLAAAQAPAVVDYSPAPPADVSWPVYVNDPESVEGPGTVLANPGTGRGQAWVDVVGPDPSDPSNPNLVGPPDGILDLVCANSDSPALPLGAGPTEWIYPPIATTTSPSNVYRGATDKTLTDVAAAMSVGFPDGFNMQYPSSSPWGVMAADYDGDGDSDLFYPCGAFNLVAQNALMRNDGDGTFTNVSTQSGIVMQQATFSGTWFDYDLDGDLDLYETNAGVLFTGVWQGDPLPIPIDRLYRNDNGSFTEVGAQAGTALESSSFSCGTSDLDRNGWPDLVVSCYRRYNKVFYNNGDGTFSFLAPGHSTEFDIEMGDVMVWHPTGKDKDFGVIPAEWAPLPVLGKLSIPVELQDFNADGWPDILYGCWSNQIPDANSLGAEGGFFEPYERAFLYLNRGDEDGDGLGDGKFREVAQEVGLDHVGGVMGMLAGDFNGDGAADVFMGGGGPDLAGNLEEDYLYTNRRSSWPRNFQADLDQPLTDAFFEVGALAGTYTNNNMAHGVSARFNDEGRLDLMLGNGGPAPLGGGQPNFYYVSTEISDGSQPRYLEVELQTTVSAPGAFGSSVRVVSEKDLDASRTSFQERRAGLGFASHDAAPLRFGLGDGGVLAVDVTWPSGIRQGRLLWPAETLNEKVFLTEPSFSMGFDGDYPGNGDIDVRLVLEDLAGTSSFVQLVLVAIRPVGPSFQFVIEPVGLPFPVAPGVPVEFEATGSGWAEGLYTILAYNQDFANVGTASLWHDPQAATASSAVHEGKPLAGVLPETVVDVERGLEVEAARVAIATARMPLEWTTWDTAVSGSVALADGSVLEWGQGRVRFTSSGRTDTLNFQGEVPVLTLGAAVACCRRDEAGPATLVRLEGAEGELVVDGRAYSVDGRPRLEALEAAPAARAGSAPR